MLCSTDVREMFRQIWLNEQSRFPEPVEISRSDFYIDDLFTRADKLEELLKRQSELQKLLKRGRFHLRKSTSNHSKLLECVSDWKHENTRLSMAKMRLRWSLRRWVYQRQTPCAKSMTKYYNLRIPRWRGYCLANQLELHGFWGGSSRAYAAATYIRVNTPSSIIVQLVAPKS